MQRGDIETLYLHDNGISSTKNVRRFPKLPDEAWKAVWMQHIRPKVTGKPTLHTDGHTMYRSSSWNFRAHYKHYWVNHQQKVYWLLDKDTNVQQGTLAIDGTWRQLRKIIRSQTGGALTYANFSTDYVYAAAWQEVAGGLSLDNQIKTVCKMLLTEG
eukprot:GEMP01080495.1.p1 GENE.GEMP01080495.1~~GEMP01080495.1.p1  ORF type:complete len:157 (+),score=27.75 GEMP01080495.1:530-1000(+)